MATHTKSAMATNTISVSDINLVQGLWRVCWMDTRNPCKVFFKQYINWRQIVIIAVTALISSAGSFAREPLSLNFRSKHLKMIIE